MRPAPSDDRQGDGRVRGDQGGPPANEALSVPWRCRSDARRAIVRSLPCALPVGKGREFRWTTRATGLSESRSEGASTLPQRERCSQTSLDIARVKYGLETADANEVNYGSVRWRWPLVTVGARERKLMTSRTDNDTTRLLSPGTPVEVLTSMATWARGFRVERVGQRGYVLRRSSDGHVLPVEFGFERVRST